MNFYKMLLEHYDYIFPYNEKQIAFLRTQLEDKQSVLDIGAGTGTAAIALSESGYHVTAVEPERGFVDKLNEKKEQKQANVSVHMGSMQTISSLSEKYDSVICIGNTLAHVRDEQELLNVLTGFAHALNQNGKLIIQVVNYHKVLQHETFDLPFIHRPDQELTFKRSYEIESDQITFNGMLTVGDDHSSASIRLFPITRERLTACLIAAGFSDITFFGGFDGQPHQLSSPALIVTATLQGQALETKY